jgi:hypothetical protein
LWNWGWGSDHAWVWTCSEAFIWVQMGCWDNGIMCKTSDGWWAVCVCMLIKSYTPPFSSLMEPTIWVAKIWAPFFL